VAPASRASVQVGLRSAEGLAGEAVMATDGGAVSTTVLLLALAPRTGVPLLSWVTAHTVSVHVPSDVAVVL
jgi:hypothetical protein